MREKEKKKYKSNFFSIFFLYKNKYINTENLASYVSVYACLAMDVQELHESVKVINDMYMGSLCGRNVEHRTSTLKECFYFDKP